MAWPEGVVESGRASPAKWAGRLGRGGSRRGFRFRASPRNFRFAPVPRRT